MMISKNHLWSFKTTSHAFEWVLKIMFLFLNQSIQKNRLTANLDVYIYRYNHQKLIWRFIRHCAYSRIVLIVLVKIVEL